MTNTFDEGSENVTQCLRLVQELSLVMLVDRLVGIFEWNDSWNCMKLLFSGLGLGSTSLAYDIVIY